MIHFSCKKIKELYYSKQTNEVKPNGLWYSVRRNWLKYFLKNIGEIKDCRYMYELKLRYIDSVNKINKNKVLRINDSLTFDAFIFKYGIIEKDKYKKNKFFIYVDWDEVAKNYGGIEVIKLFKDRLITEDLQVVKKYNNRFNFVENINNVDVAVELVFWLYSLDVGSGCVWNPGAVKGIKRVYKI